MKKVVSIGVNNVKELTPLKAAASGAIEFGIWAESQGYEVKVFTDQDGTPVQIHLIEEEVAKAVEDPNCEQIIVFFSGHGILNSPNQEIWLLSGAATRPSQAINISKSKDYARTTGIPYVVFISDACRIPPRQQKFTTEGSTIFPIMESLKDTKIDTFYATRPGNPANEVKLADSKKRFGIFTECILEILKGQHPQVINSTDSTGNENLARYYDITRLKENHDYKSRNPPKEWQIYSTDLDPYLNNIVVKKAAQINPMLNQQPQMILEQMESKPFLSRFTDGDAKSMLLKAAPLTKAVIKINSLGYNPDHSVISHDMLSLDRTDFQTQLNIEHREFISDVNISDLLDLSEKITEFEKTFQQERPKIYKDVSTILDHSPDVQLNAHTGFIILGEIIKEIVVAGNYDFSQHEHQSVIIHNPKEATTMLVILKNGESVPVAILEGFVGTLIFEKGKLLTLSYSPGVLNVNKYREYSERKNEIELARAVVASLANEGFNYSHLYKGDFNESGHVSFENAGGYLRVQKSLDPSLGLYAAYAYRQEGKTAEIESIYRYMSREEENIPYDVAMLAKKIEMSGNRVSPFCPMLALGWAYGQDYRQSMPAAIVEASNYMLPAVWTTFSKEGTQILKTAINQTLIT